MSITNKTWPTIYGVDANYIKGLGKIELNPSKNTGLLTVFGYFSSAAYNANKDGYVDSMEIQVGHEDSAEDIDKQEPGTKRWKRIKYSNIAGKTETEVEAKLAEGALAFRNIIIDLTV